MLGTIYTEVNGNRVFIAKNLETISHQIGYYSTADENTEA